MVNCRQFSLLLWKNFLLQRRAICWTIFEILLPVAVVSLMLISLLLPKYSYIKTADVKFCFEKKKKKFYKFVFCRK